MCLFLDIHFNLFVCLSIYLSTYVSIHIEDAVQRPSKPLFSSHHARPLSGWHHVCQWKGCDVDPKLITSWAVQLEVPFE
jgi:hypothetical protein